MTPVATLESRASTRHPTVTPATLRIPAYMPRHESNGLLNHSRSAHSIRIINVTISHHTTPHRTAPHRTAQHHTTPYHMIPLVTIIILFIYCVLIKIINKTNKVANCSALVDRNCHHYFIFLVVNIKYTLKIERKVCKCLHNSPPR